MVLTFGLFMTKPYVSHEFIYGERLEVYAKQEIANVI